MDKITTKCHNTTGELSYQYNPLFNLLKHETDDKYTLENLTSTKFKFSLNNPVYMFPLFKYDGTTNITFTDNLNNPRLVNSRFKISENGLFEIPTHLGLNLINIIDDDKFDSQTSLQNKINSFPKINLLRVITPGNLSVGNYTFYIAYSDAEGNLTDIAGESGIVSVFIGSNASPNSINGGYRNQNSHKSIYLSLTNLDENYNYLHIYYARSTSDINQNIITEYKELIDNIKYSGTSKNLRISGYEDVNDITSSDINVLYRIVDKAKTAACCQNRLFFGNIKEECDDIKELSDLSLRFCPYLIGNLAENEIGNISPNTYRETKSVDDKYEYYNVKNIYNKVGYWNEEIYRLGVVYLYKNGRRSSVYNIRGKKNLTESSIYSQQNVFIDDDSTIRNYISYNENTYSIINAEDENIKGVIRLNSEQSNNAFMIYSLGVKIPKDFLTLLLSLLPDIIGFYFVRLKRIPTILTQAVLMPYESKNANIPLFPIEGKYYAERFITNDGILVKSFDEHLYDATGCQSSKTFTAICPDYDLDLAHLNTILTGGILPIKRIANYTFSKSTNFEGRHIYLNKLLALDANYGSAKILGVPDNTKLLGIDSTKFRGIGGTKEEAFRVEYLNHKTTKSYKKFDALTSWKKYKFKSTNSNIFRGIFGSYLGVVINKGTYNVGDLINIYINDYDISNINDYFEIRYNDSSEYYCISDYYRLGDSKQNGFVNIGNEVTGDNYYKLTEWQDLSESDIKLYRGDCYINTYTHRFHRNFSDDSTPTNDTIVDLYTYCYHYNTDSVHVDELSNINRSDVNAVPLGVWITFKCRSNRNLALRAVDESYPDEKALYNHYRSFYPFTQITANPDYNIPESGVYNAGYGETVGHKINDLKENIIYENNDFTNRIVYSNVAVDSFYLNGLKIFMLNNYRDYNYEHGSITKLIEIGNNLICVFEHGIAYINVNEKVQTAGETGNEIYINSNKVIPEKLQFLTGGDTIGSQWADSIIKVPSGHIYGVDTVAKKIWMINGTQVKYISDLELGEFLNNNMPLKERDTQIIIGSKNVKTHYNSWKGDVMFTFYCPSDDDSKIEIAWNLCYNDFTLKWITFYSWIPLETQNVDNVMYSFDRDYARMVNEINKYAPDDE